MSTTGEVTMLSAISKAVTFTIDDQKADEPLKYDIPAETYAEADTGMSTYGQGHRKDKPTLAKVLDPNNKDPKAVAFREMWRFNEEKAARAALDAKAVPVKP